MTKEQELFASFWEHADELRKTLLSVFFIILAGFLVALWFYEPIFHLITKSAQTRFLAITPVKQALQREKIENSSSSPLIYQLPSQAFSPVKESKGIKSINPAVYELSPGASIEYEIWKIQDELLILSPLDGAMMTFKICFWISLALTSPFWSYRLLSFILPGLDPIEKRFIFPFLSSSFICLGLGAGLAYFFTIPIANQYLERFNVPLGTNSWSLTAYVDYTLILTLGHAIAFELCLILLFLVHFRVVDAESLASKRRYMIVSAFILGALLTPPDVITQFIVAIPFIGLYEIAIIYAKIRAKVPCRILIFDPNMN